MATYREYLFKIKERDDSDLFPNTVIYALFMDVSGYSYTEQILHLDSKVKNEEKLKEHIEQVAKGVPYQYVLGYTEFNGHKYIVNKDVLIPRQETEQLVKNTLVLIEKHFKKQSISVLDMCSGSGVIGIEIKLNCDADVDLVDISSKANDVARENAILNKTNVTIYKSDLFRDIPSKKYDVIISNPPYIKSKDTVDKTTLKYEPHLALFASPQTKFYEEIFRAKNHFYQDKYILAFEIDEDMFGELENLVKQYFGSKVEYYFEKDLYNKDRYLYIICDHE